MSCIVIDLETISQSSSKSYDFCLTKYLALLTQETVVNAFAHAQNACISKFSGSGRKQVGIPFACI
jgi:hypothetical protein